MSVTNRDVPPVRLERAMVFIDGTNLFYSLDAEKLSLQRSLHELKLHGDVISLLDVFRAQISGAVAARAFRL